MAPLPFNTTGEVLTQGQAAGAGTVIACSTPWPVGQRPGDVGVEHDHECQAPISAYPVLDGPNRKLLVDGKRFSVVRAYTEEFLPHTQIELKRVTG